MKAFLTFIVSTILILQNSIAQEVSTTTIDDISRHVPKSQKALEAEAETAARAVEPLPNQALDAALAAKNKIGHERVLAILAQREKYTQRLRDGEIVQNSFILEKIPQAEALLPDLDKLYQQIIEEKDAAKKVELTDAFLAALQPFGILLKDASHKEADLSLSDAQFAELKRYATEKAQALENMDEDLVPMHFIGRQYTYTTLHLSTPLVFVAKPNSYIFLESNTGGYFENGLSRIKITTDDKGVATTRWQSDGDAVSEAMIYAFSSSTSDVGSHMIRVVDLKLRDLPSIDELKQKAHHLKQEAAHRATQAQSK